MLAHQQARIILDGHRIRFCPTARSGELAPAGAAALMSQRLRWFIGWEQCTAKYWLPLFRSPLPPLRKLGFIYMFHFRWALLVSAFLGAVVNPILMSPFAYPLWTWSTPVRYCTYITLLFYSFVAAYSVCSCVWHERYRPFSWVGVALFYALGWLYIGWHALHRCAARTPPPPAPLSSRRVLGGGQHPGVAVAPVVTRRALKTLPGSVFPP